jgi:hypothetical protein
MSINIYSDNSIIRTINKNQIAKFIFDNGLSLNPKTCIDTYIIPYKYLLKLTQNEMIICPVSDPVCQIQLIIREIIYTNSIINFHLLNLEDTEIIIFKWEDEQIRKVKLLNLIPVEPRYQNRWFYISFIIFIISVLFRIFTTDAAI